MRSERLRQADEQLERAVKAWLKVKASEPEEGDPDGMLTDDPVTLGFALVAAYTTPELDRDGGEVTAFGCAENMTSYAARGLLMAGVDKYGEQQ